MSKTMKIIGSGSYADVFEMSCGRALKVYRRRTHSNVVYDASDPGIDWRDHDAVTRAHFRAEARAYELLQSSALKLFVPQYFGRFDPSAILDPELGAEKYLKGCGLIIERIQGRAVKLAHLDKAAELQASSILEQIRDALTPVVAINVWDASCFVPGARAAFTLIDFALWEAERYEMALGQDRCLTVTERAMLELENQF